MIRTNHTTYTTWTLAIALLLLVLTPMVAQAQQSGSQDQNPQASETRTRPGAADIAQGSGLTLRATVKEVRDDQLVLDTPTGTRYVQLTDRTRKPVNLTAGQDVAVDYTRSEQGVMIAKDVRLISEGQVAEESSTATNQAETGAMTDQQSRQTESETMESDSTQAAENGSMDRDSDQMGQMNRDNETEQYASNQASSSSMDNDSNATSTSTRDRDRLPTTASELPLAALMGLMALGGAVAFRAFRS